MRDWKICLQGISRGARAAFIAFPSNQLEPHQSSSRPARTWATRHWLHFQAACVMNEWIFQPAELIDGFFFFGLRVPPIDNAAYAISKTHSFVQRRFQPHRFDGAFKNDKAKKKKKKDLFKYYWNSSDYRSHVCACLIGLTFFVFGSFFSLARPNASLVYITFRSKSKATDVDSNPHN